VVPSNVVLDRVPSAQEGDVWDLNPQSKFVLQIVAKLLQIEEWLLWTACRNSAMPYPAVPSLI